MAGLEWLLLPVLGSAVLCLLLVPLGYQVIARGVIFADLAIAQWAALGALIGMYLLPDIRLAGAPVSSVVFALFAALVVHLIFRQAGGAKEAWIGVLYVVGASLAVLLVSGDPHGAQALHRTASGDLLWASREQVLAVGALMVLIWGLHLVVSSWLAGPLFLPLFALSVTWSVSLSGIYVVFATLIITPLLIGLHMGKRPLVAAMCALAGHSLAIVASVVFDVPIGPAIVIATLVVTFVWVAVRGLQTTLNL